jgi:hypothetical protein
MFTIVWCLLSTPVVVESLQSDKLRWLDGSTDKAGEAHSEIVDICSVGYHQLAEASQVLVTKLNSVKNLMMPPGVDDSSTLKTAGSKTSLGGTPVGVGGDDSSILKTAGSKTSLDSLSVGVGDPSGETESSISSEELSQLKSAGSKVSVENPSEPLSTAGIRKRVREFLFADKLSTTYYTVSTITSVAQFLAEGLLANAGESASTSPATVLASDKECRDTALLMISAVMKGETLDTATKSAAMCIGKDMDKCVPKMRNLQWIGAGIDNAQSILDTFWALYEIERVTEDIQNMGDSSQESAQRLVQVQKQVARDHMMAESETIQKFDAIEQHVVALKTLMSGMLHQLTGDAPLPSSPVDGKADSPADLTTK